MLGILLYRGYVMFGQQTAMLAMRAAWLHRPVQLHGPV